MASVITYNSLSDEESMYNNLKERIQNAQYFTDLLPLIASLFTFDQIKRDLISALDKKYKWKPTASMGSEQNSQIRPIFVALNTFNGIPSDVMHANIISFLPSKDYKKLPLVSKNFRNIMLKYPFIYNEKAYKIDIDYRQNLMSPSNTPLKIRFEHERHSVIISNESLIVPKSILLKNSEIPINSIKYWSLNTAPSASTKDLLIKYQNNIQKLEIKSHQNIINTMVDESDAFKFEQCKVLLIRSSILPVLQTNDIFCRLQCLEIFHETSIGMMGMPPPGMMGMGSRPNPLMGMPPPELTGLPPMMPPPNPMMGPPPWMMMEPSKEYYQKINKMLAYLSPTLKCFTFQLPPMPPPPVPTLAAINHSNTEESNEMLVIPENIEWLKLKIECKLDISKCSKLIGMDLNKPSAFYGTIKWPKDYLIPFVYFSNRYCQEPLTNGSIKEEIFKDPYARFMIIKSKAKKPRKELYDYGVKISDIISKLNHKPQDTTDESLVGLELHPDELNDEMESLFLKLMKYCFQDEKIRNDKIELYQAWWQLKSSVWIKHLGKK